MSKVLVTGGAGFIGSHLSEALLKDGHRVVCLDNFNDYYNPEIKRNNLGVCLAHDGFTLVEGDITDFPFVKTLFQKTSFEIVVHLAARAGVRPSIQQPLLYQRVNVEGTTNLLEAAVRSGVSKFVFGSSSSVYGATSDVPFREDQSVDFPISPYAATKKAGELLCYTYHHLHGLPVTCLRFFTVYGPRQRPDMAIHKFTRLIHSRRKIPMYGAGDSKRDYTYITDIIDGIGKAIEHCRGYHIYNLGESQTTTLCDLIELLGEYLDVDPAIERLPMQPGDVPITYADISKAREEIGYQPSTPIAVGLQKFVHWYLDSPSVHHGKVTGQAS